MNSNNCADYGTDCPGGTISTWVDGDKVLSWTVNVVILCVVGALLMWGCWYFFGYRRRPFCVDCLKEGSKVRTKWTWLDEPVCAGHSVEREMVKEEVYKCSKHGVPYEKQEYGEIIIDRCPEGCIFLDDGELEEIAALAKSSGQTTGMVIGMAIS